MSQQKKDPQELALLMDPKAISSRIIISQNPHFIRGFIGNVGVFRQFIKAEEILLRCSGWGD